MWTHRFVVGRKCIQVRACSLPDKEFMVSSAEGLAGKEEPQLDWANGPVTVTRLSGCSRAAFTGVMVLKRTPDRQPVKPREANPTKSASSSDSESSEKQRSPIYQPDQFTPVQFSPDKHLCTSRGGGEGKWYYLHLNDFNILSLSSQTRINLLQHFHSLQFL